ncbi:MAG TPA: hypothetical protein VFH57_02910, partial [Gammaproteobacteria bacterium]|nr:hypothetical protein [Gammaproteobacteria bacterium]
GKRIHSQRAHDQLSSCRAQKPMLNEPNMRASVSPFIAGFPCQSDSLLTLRTACTAGKMASHLRGRRD